MCVYDVVLCTVCVCVLLVLTFCGVFSRLGVGVLNYVYTFGPYNPTYQACMYCVCVFNFVFMCMYIFGVFSFTFHLQRSRPTLISVSHFHSYSLSLSFVSSLTKHLHTSSYLP